MLVEQNGCALTRYWAPTVALPDVAGASFLPCRLLSKNPDPNTPLPDQEYYELSLLDEANGVRTRYCVRQVRAVRVEADGQFIWNHEEVEYFWILAEAKRRYEERKRALAEKGFIYSDIDSIL